MNGTITQQRQLAIQHWALDIEDGSRETLHTLDTRATMSWAPFDNADTHNLVTRIDSANHVKHSPLPVVFRACCRVVCLTLRLGMETRAVPIQEMAFLDDA